MLSRIKEINDLSIKYNIEYNTICYLREELFIDYPETTDYNILEEEIIKRFINK